MGKKQNAKHSDKQGSLALYKRLLWEVRALWPIMVIAVFGSALYSASDAYSIYLIKPIINKGFAMEDAGYLKVIAGLILILFVLRGLGSFLSTFFMGKLGANVVLKFRVRLFKKFLTLPSSYYDRSTSGQLLSKLLYNVDQISAATGSALTTIAQDGAFAIGLLVVMITVSWKLSLTIIIVVPFLGVFIAWISKRFRRLSRKTQDAMGGLTHVAEESLKSYREIRIFGGQRYQEEKFYKSIMYTYTQQIKTMMTDAMSSPMIQIMGAIVLAIVVYLAAMSGEDASMKHWLNAGEFVSFFTAMLAILKPIKNLTRVNSTIQKALAATEDLYTVIDHDEELDSGKKTLEHCKGRVAFDNVSFKYKPESDERILDKVSFDVNAGETIALVGKSGGGKSTLISLLARFYNPIEGKISLDDIDTQELTLESLRKHLSLVSQHVSLFDDTIFNNIAFGLQSREATRDEVIKAAKAAQAWDFINELPEGLATRVGENGFNLSGGQRQRIAIARAILKDAPILMLDEATSALDNESERAVQEALVELMKGRTTFVVAHRLSTIEHADKIVVMNHGEVVEMGTHAELIEKEGMYASLYQKAQISEDGVMA